MNKKLRTTKIRDILKVKSGRDQKNVECKNGKYQILGTGGEIGRTNSFLYNKPSVLIGRKGTIDRPFYKDEPFWTVDTLFYTEIKDGFMPKYIYYLFQTINWKKYNEASGVPSLTASTIENIVIQVPDLATQKKIVAILEKWDAAIENLKRQILEEEKVSKGLLNKTFPLYGNYNNLTKMIDVAIIEKGRALSAKQIVNGDYPVFAGGIESPYSHNDFTHENVITVSASGANAGYVAYRKGKIWASDCNVVKGDGVRTLTMFLYYWLKSRQRYIYSLQTGGAQPHVHASDIAKLQIEVPSINNQFKIINILGAQDQKLTLLRQKLSNYEKQRKYLLNRLLSGKEDI